MFRSYEEMKNYIETEDIQTLDIKIPDIRGLWRHLSIPASRVSPELFESGFGFDGSNYGYAPVEASDMVFVPDWTTAFRDPFWEEPTLAFMGHVREITPQGFTPFAGDPRVILENAVEFMRKQGTADEFVVGPEFEYHAFDDVSYWSGPEGCGFVVESRQREWAESEGLNNGGYRTPALGGYHIDAPWDINRDLRAEAAGIIESMGVRVKYHHHEVGGPGQQEIEVELDEARKLADASQIIKYVVRNTAAARGLTATFMPKPLYGEAGNGMHVHMLLRKNGHSVFAGDHPTGLSETGLRFLGGILRHTPALMGLVCPSTNSYRRLVKGYEAPIAIAFAMANRSAAVRIPGYAKDPESRRFEFRSGDATANVYLMFAALLMAGLDGVRREIDPVEEGYGPLQKNIYEEHDSVRMLPATLEEALDELEKDNDFLTESGVFPESLVSHWINLKRREAKEIHVQVHPGEYDLYWGC